MSQQKSLLDLTNERSYKAQRAKELLATAEKESRVLVEEERALCNTLLADVDALSKEILERQEHQKTRERINTVLEDLSQPQGRRTTPDQPAIEGGSRRAPIPENLPRYGRLRAFKGPKADETAFKCGHWIRAALLGDPRSVQFCNDYGFPIQAALGTTPNTGAGYLIPEQFSQTIIDLRESYGVFRQNTRVVPMSSDTIVVPRRSGGITVAFVGENPSSGATASDPTFNQVRLTAKKLLGLTLMSTEVAEDAIIDLADWVANEFAYAFALKEDQCGFTGTGTSTYGGIRGVTDILKANQSLAGAVDGASGHDTFAEMDATDLATTMAALPAFARPNAKWFVSAVGYDLVFGRLMASAGGNTIRDIEGGYQRMYLGYPIVISQVLPTSTGDLSDVAMLLFGDLSLASTMGERRGINVMRSDDRYFEYDQVGIRATERVDIVVHDYGTSTVGGPIVALVGE